MELLFKEASEVDDFTIRCQAALDHATGPTHIAPKIKNCILSIIPELKPQEVDYVHLAIYAHYCFKINDAYLNCITNLVKLVVEQVDSCQKLERGVGIAVPQAESLSDNSTLDYIKGINLQLLMLEQNINFRRLNVKKAFHWTDFSMEWSQIRTYGDFLISHTSVIRDRYKFALTRSLELEKLSDSRAAESDKQDLGRKSFEENKWSAKRTAIIAVFSAIILTLGLSVGVWGNLLKEKELKQKQVNEEANIRKDRTAKPKGIEHPPVGRMD